MPWNTEFLLHSPLALLLSKSKLYKIHCCAVIQHINVKYYPVLLKHYLNDICPASVTERSVFYIRLNLSPKMWI